MSVLSPVSGKKSAFLTAGAGQTLAWWALPDRVQHPRPRERNVAVRRRPMKVFAHHS